MKRFKNSHELVIMHDDMVAYAGKFGRELTISVYRKGFKSAADDIMVHGGKLEKEARATSVELFRAILRAAKERWHGEELYCEPSDARRMRTYTRIMEKYGVQHTVSGALLSFTF